MNTNNYHQQQNYSHYYSHHHQQQQHSNSKVVTTKQQQHYQQKQFQQQQQHYQQQQQQLIIMNNPNEQEPKIPDQVSYYALGRTIGKGASGIVKIAKHTLTNTLVAVKIVNKTKLDTEHFNRLLHEVHIMQRLSHPSVAHPHITRLFEVVNTPVYMYIFMELCTAGRVDYYLRSFGDDIVAREKECRRLFFQLASALEYCHSVNIFHRDLKPCNVLLDVDNNVKLTDFGLSVQCWPDQSVDGIWVGTPYYMAPELFRREAHKPMAVDVWATGVVLYEMVTGTRPFKASTYEELMAVVLKNQIDFPHGVSNTLKRLLLKMLAPNAAERPTFSQILSHRWLRQVSPLSMNSQQPQQQQQQHTSKSNSEEALNSVGVSDSNTSNNNNNTSKTSRRPPSLASTTTVIYRPPDHNYLIDRLEKLGFEPAHVHTMLKEAPFGDVSGIYNTLHFRKSQKRIPLFRPEAPISSSSSIPSAPSSSSSSSTSSTSITTSASAPAAPGSKNDSSEARERSSSGSSSEGKSRSNSPVNGTTENNANNVNSNTTTTNGNHSTTTTTTSSSTLTSASASATSTSSTTTTTTATSKLLNNVANHGANNEATSPTVPSATSTSIAQPSIVGCVPNLRTNAKQWLQRQMDEPSDWDYSRSSSKMTAQSNSSTTLSNARSPIVAAAPVNSQQR